MVVNVNLPTNFSIKIPQLKDIQETLARLEKSGGELRTVLLAIDQRTNEAAGLVASMDGARPIWPRRAGKSRKYAGSNVWTVGVDTAKDAIYSKVKVEAPGPGYCHFPDAYQREYFEQLTSEEVRTRFVRGHPVRYWFKPSGVRNEALDRRVYALAALHARPVPWEVLLRAAPSEPPTPPEPTRPAAPAPRPTGRRLRFKFGGRG